MSALRTLRGPVPLEIAEERLERRHDAVLVVPTYRGGTVTAATLREVLDHHPHGGIDLLVVDNSGGEDVAAIRAALPADAPLNWLVLTANAGPAGAFHVAQLRAYEAGYGAVILSDNDTRLLTPNGLTTMLAKLPADGFGAVAPTFAYEEPEPDHEVRWADWEFFVLGRAALERVGTVDPAYFFGFEDYDFVTRVVSAGVPILRTGEVRSFHPFRKPATFYNWTTYSMVRGYCLYCFTRRPSPLAARFRVRTLAHLAMYAGARLLASAATRDSTIARTVLRGFRDARRTRLRLDVPANRFVYERIPCDGGGFHDLASLTARLVPRERYAIVDPLTGERECWERRPAADAASGPESRL
jgi:GT2 family glycosyltransferase